MTNLENLKTGMNDVSYADAIDLIDSAFVYGVSFYIDNEVMVNNRISKTELKTKLEANNRFWFKKINGRVHTILYK